MERVEFAKKLEELRPPMVARLAELVGTSEDSSRRLRGLARTTDYTHVFGAADREAWVLLKLEKYMDMYQGQ